MTPIIANFPSIFLADTVRLKFIGEWSTPVVFLTGLLLAGVMFFYYRRELRFHGPIPRFFLPGLRALAVFLIVLCLAGPTLRRETIIRQLNRILILVDSSASMSFTDQPAGTPDDTTPPTSPGTTTTPSRFHRAQQALLHHPHRLIETLLQSQHQNIELFALRNHKADRIWWHRDNGKDISGALPSQIAKPDAQLTNLDQPLRDALGPSLSNSAIILLTDGQHNSPGSPEALAVQLSNHQIPIFAIGYGQEAPPQDISLTQIIAPEAAFPNGRVEGVIHLNDHLPEGLQAVAIVSDSQQKTLSREEFSTDGSGRRQFTFSFPVSDLIGDSNATNNATSKAQDTLRHLSARVELIGDSSSTSKDLIPHNNQSNFAIHLLSQKRKVLLLDGRPRWETRYLHTHFDRDERWEITTAFDDFTDTPNSAIQKAFPKDEKEMQNYDLVILGDLRPESLPPDKHQLLQQFVEKHGGGLIFIDGQRGHLQSWRQTSIESLIPVTWNPNPAAIQPGAQLAHELTPSGLNLTALSLSDTPSTNQTLWQHLPGIFWASSAKPLPDATTLVQLIPANASTSTSADSIPGMVWRRYGAGSVLWLASDEYWRWRYEVADLYHQRFWMQIAAWIAAPPFIVQDDRLSLSIDRLRYHENDKAEVRIRLRDAKGNPVIHHDESTPLRAHLHRNGKLHATLQLESDPVHGGVFRAISGNLPSGEYRLTVSQNQQPVSDISLSFQVTDSTTQEWSNLTLNRPLLESIARTSGGRFLRESDIAQLPALLRQADRPQLQVQESLLWSSWWWFTPILILLTAEWLLRKHWRLV